MPATVDKLRINNPFTDKRVKLLPCQKEMVVYWRENFGSSQRELARIFKVSRRLIQFTLDENKHIENLKRREERGGTKKYYDKEKYKNAMRDHRSHKKNLYLK